MHLSKKVFLLGSQYGIQALTPLVIFPIAARVIGLEEFGLLSSVLSISTFGMFMIQYSFNQEGIQWISREKHLEKGILSKIFKTKLILFFHISLTKSCLHPCPKYQRKLIALKRSFFYYTLSNKNGSSCISQVFENCH